MSKRDLQLGLAALIVLLGSVFVVWKNEELESSLGTERAAVKEVDDLASDRMGRAVVWGSASRMEDGR